MGKYNFRINGHDYQVDVNSVEGGIADVTVNGTDYKVELADAVPAPAQQAVRPAPQTVFTGAPAVTPQATAPAARRQLRRQRLLHHRAREKLSQLPFRA